MFGIIKTANLFTFDHVRQQNKPLNVNKLKKNQCHCLWLLPNYMLEHNVVVVTMTSDERYQTILNCLNKIYTLILNVQVVRGLYLKLNRSTPCKVVWECSFCWIMQGLCSYLSATLCREISFLLRDTFAWNDPQLLRRVLASYCITPAPLFLGHNSVPVKQPIK